MLGDRRAAAAARRVGGAARARRGARDLGLGESEVLDLTEALELEHLDGYTAAVTERSRAILDRLDLDSLDAVPDRRRASASSRCRGERSAVAPGCGMASPHRSSSRGKTSDSGLDHLGEMVSVRNRMGLSPLTPLRLERRRCFPTRLRADLEPVEHWQHGEVLAASASGSSPTCWIPSRCTCPRNVPASRR